MIINPNKNRAVQELFLVNYRFKKNLAGPITIYIKDVVMLFAAICFSNFSSITKKASKWLFSSNIPTNAICYVGK